jgi:hypothetical protein
MRIRCLIVMPALAVVLAACSGDDDGAVSAPTATPTATAQSTPTATPTATDTPAPTSTDTPPPTSTPTLPPTATATSTATPTATATVTPTDTPSLVEQLESRGVGRYLGMFQPARTGTNGVWEAYFFDPAEENAICLKGGEYQVLIRRGTTNNVLLYLEGGGACWSNETCWEGAFFAKEGECVKDDRNRSYLEISVTPGPGDLRMNVVPFDHVLFTPSFLGTHVVDYNFAVGDLIDLVEEKAAALREQP